MGKLIRLTDPETRVTLETSPQEKNLGEGQLGVVERILLGLTRLNQFMKEDKDGPQ